MTRVVVDATKKAGGFAPSTPTVEPPGATSLRGFVPRSEVAPGGSPVGVEGAKPPAFFVSSAARHVV
jgi:hypothetical protein